MDKKVKYSLLVSAAGVATSIYLNKSGGNTQSNEKITTVAILGGVTAAACFSLHKNHPIIAILVGFSGIAATSLMFALISHEENM